MSRNTTGAQLETVSGSEAISRLGAAQCLRQWRAFGFKPARSYYPTYAVRIGDRPRRSWHRVYVVDGAELHTLRV